VKSIPKDIQNNFTSRIVYYLNTYFITSGIFLDKNSNENLYKKVPDSLIAYDYIGNFEKFILDNYSLIFDKLKDELFYFLNTDLLKFMLIEKFDKVLKAFKILLHSTSIEFNFNIIEFSDGLYFADSNIFAKKKRCIQFSKQFYTLRFFNKTYKSLFKYYNHPHIWKTKLLYNFTEDEFIHFCKIFRVILFGGLKTKLDTLLLLGISNSGKSKLVLDIIVKSYGLQNINFLSIDKKLNSEELSLYKNFRLSKEMLNLFDNLSFGEIFSINLVKQFIITSNYTKELLICLDNEALKNRVNKFIFNNECNLTNEEIRSIEEELPQILVYCNNIFFDSKKSRKIFNQILLID
jgi:hypothetical protein